MSEKVFFQDFLFENMPVDKDEYPLVPIKYLTTDPKEQITFLSLDKLFRLSTKSEWNKLFEIITNKVVCIVDDVPVQNEEMRPYKMFYLKTYIYNLSQHCRMCLVDRRTL